MESLPGYLVAGGYGIAILAQIIGGFLAFRLGIAQGFFSLVIPGYMLFALKRTSYYWKVVGFWMFGLGCVVLGAVIASQ